MKIVGFILLPVLLYVEHATGQKIFSQADLKGVYKSFDGSGCPSDTRRHDINKKKYFRYLQESDSNSNNLYVGAMNNVYKLNVTTMQCLNYNESKPTNNTIRRCYIQGKGRDVECQNHIRVVMEIGKGLLVCGTGGYSPIRYQLNLQSLGNISDQLQINETFNGVAYCPFDPYDNYTAILVTKGNPDDKVVPYFGTYTDFIKSSPVFYRPKFSGNDGRMFSEKTTDREEINWLNSPQFVGSFDDEEKVMFFFRETAVENVGRNVIYSRVGKVCKQDLGGGLTDAATKKEWLSFQKARLICSLPGSNPHYFDDIYDVYQSDDKQYYYALFFKQKEYDEDSVASAVCLYKKSDIETVFSGKFQTESSSGQWVPLTDSQNPNPRLDNCTAHKNSRDIFNKKSSVYQLMAENVKPFYGKPIYHKTGVQFIRIAVSKTEKNSDNSETGKNIYLASDEGEIYDIFMKTYENENTFLVENPPTIYRPFTSAKSRDYSVWSMKVLDNALFFGTDFNVTRFDIDLVCEKIKDINVCIANTRCEWSKCDGGSCVKAESSKCSILDWRNISKAGVIASIQDEIKETQQEDLKTVGEGLYFTVPFKAKIFTDDIFWYNSDHCSGINVLKMDPEKYAISFSKDLVIKNLTIERDNNSLYSVCYNGQQALKLKGYKITVASGNDDIIEVWKQQFNEWSSAFVRWKGCTKTYYDSCEANNGGG